MTTFRSVSEIRKANEDQGSHWFSRKTMAFFKSRVTETVINGNFFVSSEKPPYGPRGYTIRYATSNGSIDTVGGLLQYSTRAAAERAARRCGTHTLADGRRVIILGPDGALLLVRDVNPGPRPRRHAGESPAEFAARRDTHGQLHVGSAGVTPMTVEEICTQLD